jgi:hypothetical protein
MGKRVRRHSTTLPAVIPEFIQSAAWYIQFQGARMLLFEAQKYFSKTSMKLIKLVTNLTIFEKENQNGQAFCH